MSCSYKAGTQYNHNKFISVTFAFGQYSGETGNQKTVVSQEGFRTQDYIVEPLTAAPQGRPFLRLWKTKVSIPSNSTTWTLYSAVPIL